MLIFMADDNGFEYDDVKFKTLHVKLVAVSKRQPFVNFPVFFGMAARPYQKTSQNRFINSRNMTFHAT